MFSAGFCRGAGRGDRSPNQRAGARSQICAIVTEASAIRAAHQEAGDKMRPYGFMLVLAGLWPGPLVVAAEAPDQAQSGTALVNPLGVHSLERLSATRDRPLFAPNRRRLPPPPPAVEAPPPPPPPVRPPALVVLGIVADGDGVQAMIRSAASDKILRVRIDDDVEGWKVTQIESRSVVLSHDERSVTFAMFTGEDRKPGPTLAGQNRSQYADPGRRGR